MVRKKQHYPFASFLKEACVMAFLSCGHLPTVDCDFFLLPKIGSAMLEGRWSQIWVWGGPAWARFPTILLPVTGTAIFRGTGCYRQGAISYDLFQNCSASMHGPRVGAVTGHLLVFVVVENALTPRSFRNFSVSNVPLTKGLNHFAVL